LNEVLRRAAIAIEGLEYVYQPHGVVALRGIDVAIRWGEFVGIVGHNGAGKTTLLKHVVGLLLPTSGRVSVGGMDTRQTTVAELTTWVGFVSQNPDQQLFAQTVEEEIAFGPRNLGLSEDEIRERVAMGVAMTGLEEFRHEFPPALAKGDRAKVVIASVLAMKPRVIILDEPTTGQDYRGSRQIMQIARRLHEEGRTMLVVTHDMALVAEYAERVVVLSQGQVLLDGATADVFSRPEVLRRTHVTPPQITRLAQTLPRELGLPACALTVEQLGEAVVERFGQRRGVASMYHAEDITRGHEEGEV
jgi:energy-coupling factor transport system ATP-binding protein